jgi:hypothetical protein
VFSVRSIVDSLPKVVSPKIGVWLVDGDNERHVSVVVIGRHDVYRASIPLFLDPSKYEIRRKGPIGRILVDHLTRAENVANIVTRESSLKAALLGVGAELEAAVHRPQQAGL